MSETIESGARGRKILLLVIGGILVVGLVAAGLMLTRSLNPEVEEQSATYDEPITRLSMESLSGDVTVVAAEGDTIKVERTVKWSGDKPHSKEVVSGGDLTITTEGCEDRLWISRCEIDYRIEVPPTVELDLRTHSGDLAITGTTAAIDATASSGDLTIVDTTGSLDLTTYSGDVTASGIDSPEVTVDVASGDLELSGVTEALTVLAHSGEVTATDLVAPVVSLEVSSGSVELGFVEAPVDVQVNASSGSVDIVVPDDQTAYLVDAVVHSGKQRVSVDTGGTDHHIGGEVSSGDFNVRYA